ncbi:MAG: NAD-dependent protein deacylase, partial [Firmicutes bacterium]|nr:NAD-dependent protein deacylase [Bacillota bacterium]
DSYIRGAELLIVGGTSLTVWPAAGYVARFRGAHLVIINRDSTLYDSNAELIFHESIGEVLGSLEL